MSKRRIRFFIYALVVGVIFFALGRVYYKLTDDFRIANITYEVPHQPEWDIPRHTTEEQHIIDDILDQPFHYLAKGAQTYAFVSEDEKYVIKFFKFKHHKPSWYLSLLPPLPPFEKFREYKLAKHKRKLDNTYSGYMLAFTLNREESGIITMHLNRTDHLNKKIFVTDKLGFHKEIDLDSVVFIIQEKATVTHQAMDSVLKEGNLPLAKEYISNIFQLYLKEFQKGIYDRDHCVMKNCGIMAKRVVHFDVGKLSRNDQMKRAESQKEGLEKLAKTVSKWIQANHPQYQQDITLFMHHKITELI